MTFPVLVVVAVLGLVSVLGVPEERVVEMLAAVVPASEVLVAVVLDHEPCRYSTSDRRRNFVPDVTRLPAWRTLC